MKIRKLHEAGFEEAMYGLSLSFKHPTADDEWWNEERKKRAYNVAMTNAPRGKGHNKFLEHMICWYSIEATLEWWKQMDTYRIGMSKQSESTMHTLNKDSLPIKAFDVIPSDFDSSEDFNLYIDYIKMIAKQRNIRTKSKSLPQSYLQEREVVLSYKTLQNIIIQRKGHKLAEWEQFIDTIFKTISFPEFLFPEYLETK